MTITKEQARKKSKEYVKNKGNHCPICGLASVGYSYDTERYSANGEMTVEASCSNCFSSWIVVYKISRIKGAMS